MSTATPDTDTDTDSDPDPTPETDTDTDSDSEDDIPLDDLRVRMGLVKGSYTPKLGDIVEVYWVGEGKWFEGEVIQVKKGMYRVFYKFDSEKMWHDKSARVRLKR